MWKSATYFGVGPYKSPTVLYDFKWSQIIPNDFSLFIRHKRSHLESFYIIWSHIRSFGVSPFKSWGNKVIYTYYKLAMLTVLFLAGSPRLKSPHMVSIWTRILNYQVWKIKFDELEFLSSLNYSPDRQWCPESIHTLRSKGCGSTGIKGCGSTQF